MADVVLGTGQSVPNTLFFCYRDMGDGTWAQVHAATITDLDLPATTVLPMFLAPQTAGGCTVYRNIDQDETGTVAKAAPGQVYGWYIYNAGSAVRYLKLYSKATAAVNTDTPLMTIPIPATSGANVFFAAGIPFALGLSLRATTGVADNDVGAPGGNEVIVNILYA